MKTILGYVDGITRHRDQALLDISIAQALAELIPGSTIRLLALRNERGAMLAATSLSCSAAGCEFWGEEEAAESAPLRIDQDALLERCVSRARAVSERLPRGGARTVFPMIEGEATLALLEFSLPRPLSRSQQQLVQGFLALHRNFVSLLRYSQIDALTGLLNRKTFDENLRRYVSPDAASLPANVERAAKAPCRRAGGPAEHWLAVIDIDHFKRINDRFGHLYGDEVLILMSKLMRESFRHQDKLFRFGGEEFVVVLRSPAAEDARKGLERFRHTVENYDFPQVGRVTASIGFTRILPGDPPAAIIGRADDALYHAKEHGRNRVDFYEDLASAGLVKQKMMNTEVELF